MTRPHHARLNLVRSYYQYRRPMVCLQLDPNFVDRDAQEREDGTWFLGIRLVIR